MASLQLAPNATTGDWNGGRRRGSDQGVMGDFHLHPPYGRSHSEVVTTGPRKVVCLDFSRGRCMKGINCPWSHDTMSNTHGQTSFTAFPTHNNSPFPTYMQQGGKGQAPPSVYETHHNREPTGFPHHQAPIPNPPLAPYRRRSPILSDRAAQPLLTFGDLPLHQASAPTGPIIDNGIQRVPHGRAPSSPSMPYAPRSMRPQTHPPHVAPPRFAGGNPHQGDNISNQRRPQPPPGIAPVVRLRGGYTMAMTRQSEAPPLRPLNTNTPRSPPIGDGVPRWPNALQLKQEWHPGGPTVVQHALSPEATPSEEGVPPRERQPLALSPATKEDPIPPALWQLIMKTAQPASAGANGVQCGTATSSPKPQHPRELEGCPQAPSPRLASPPAGEPAVQPSDIVLQAEPTTIENHPTQPVSLGPPLPHTSPAQPETQDKDRYRDRPRICWKSGEVCRQFQKDKCEYGAACRHHHIRLSRPFRYEETSEICRDFVLFGQCRYGERCHNVHLTLERYPELLRHDAPTRMSSALHRLSSCLPAEVLPPPSSHDDRGATTSTADEAQGLSLTASVQRQRSMGDKSVAHTTTTSSPLTPAASASFAEDDAPTPRPHVRLLPEGAVGITPQTAGERLEGSNCTGAGTQDRQQPRDAEQNKATTPIPATPDRNNAVASRSIKMESRATSSHLSTAARTSASGEPAGRITPTTKKTGVPTSNQPGRADVHAASPLKAKLLAPRAASPNPSNTSERSSTPGSVGRTDSGSDSRKGKTLQVKGGSLSPALSNSSTDARKGSAAASTAKQSTPDSVKKKPSRETASVQSKKPEPKSAVEPSEEPKPTGNKPATSISGTEKSADAKPIASAVGAGKGTVSKDPGVDAKAASASSGPKSKAAGKTLVEEQQTVSSKASGPAVGSPAASARATCVDPTSATSATAAVNATKDAAAVPSSVKEVCRRFQQGLCQTRRCPRVHVLPDALATQSEASLISQAGSQTSSAAGASCETIDGKPGDKESVAGSKSSRRRKKKQKTSTTEALEVPSESGHLEESRTERSTVSMGATGVLHVCQDAATHQPSSALPMAPSLSTSTTSSEGSSDAVSLVSSNRSSPYTSNASISPMVAAELTPDICRDWWRGRCYRQQCIFEHPKTVETLPATAYARPAQGEAPDTRPRTPQKGSPLIPPGLGLENKITPLTSPPRRDLDETITITVLDATRVTFGPGLQIHRLQTGFESTQIFLNDLPSSATPAAITLALEAFGDVTAVNMLDGSKNMKGAAARVTFSKPEEAAEAVTALDGAQFLGTTVSARPDMFRSSVGKGTLRDGDVLITFPAPNRTGYVGYATMKEAEKAIKKANNYEMRGNLLRAVHYEGLPMVGSHNVRFVGLPGDATSADLDVFGPNEGVMMKHPLYVSLKRAIDGLLSMLLKFDSSVTLNVLPPPYKRDVRAWAHFSKPSIAERFCETAHGHRHGFIGNSSLVAKHFRTLAWTLPGNVYDVLSDEIRLLRAYLWDTEFSTSVSIFDMRWGAGRTAPVKVKLVSTDIQKMTKPKAAFEALLRGERVTHDGETVWDGYFSSRPGILFLEELERNYRGVLINKDSRRRTLALFGSPVPRGRVRDAIVAKFNLLRKQRIHIIPLGRLIGLFVKTDLHLLQDQLGRENVVLDLGTRVLKVRGGEDAQKAAQLAIARARTRHPEERQSQSSECLVCLDDVTDPYTLKCGHAYCRTCISDYLVAATDTKAFPLTCLGDDAKCSHHIPLDAAQQLLPPDAFEALTRASFLAYVHSRPKEFFYCPTPDCEQVYRATPKGKVLQCPSCLVQICGHCHVEYHTGEECHDLEAEDQAHFEEWKKGRDVKNCPNCKATIEREAGCNHMTCTRCKTHICWVCLETFEKGEDVYPHMRTIHGGIGL